MNYDVNKCSEYAMKDSEGEKLDVKAINTAIEEAKEHPTIPTTLSVNTLTSTNDEITAQKPVVEVMTGYNFTALPVTNLSVDYLYVGAVKNGNKLTLVVFLQLERTGEVLANGRVGKFSYPSEIEDKLIPFRMGGEDVLESLKVEAWSNLNTSVSLNAYFNKYYGINIVINSVADLVLNQIYYARFEATFLLSDNLAPVTP